jgi:hypothetical protein
MKAFHGDPAVKEKYLARLKAHHVADEIIQGTRWNGAHGCAVGCTLNNYAHEAYETELGLPQWLAHLEDKIFEGLPPKAAQQFAVDLLESVPVGADVSKVRWQLASKRHTRSRDRIAQIEEPYARKVVRALSLIIEYCDSEYKTESAAAAAAESARSAARSARSAARSASWSAWSAAARSARSAARSAESAAWSAESAAWSAAESAVWSASWSAHFKWEAETLLEMLRAAPVEV